MSAGIGAEPLNQDQQAGGTACPTKLARRPGVARDADVLGGAGGSACGILTSHLPRVENVTQFSLTQRSLFPSNLKHRAPRSNDLLGNLGAAVVSDMRGQSGRQ